MATPRICSIEGCGKVHLARGWCLSHYTNWHKYGDPLTRRGTPKGEPMRFLRNVALSHEGDSCLRWPFSIGDSGYGRLFSGCRNYRIASSVLCEMAHGERPSPTHEAAHSCGNRACVSPQHLRWATPQENSDDKDIHGTKPLGRRSGKAKLTENDILAIRAAEGVAPSSELAGRYGVHSNTIRVIQRGLRWGWLR